MTGAIDVIVCVYSAGRETRLCLEALLKNQELNGFGIIVVNDKSPDEETSLLLEEIATLPSVTIINNEENKGYTKSANIGLAASSAEFRILLNSDAVTFGDWAQRMYAHYAENQYTGLVSPLSNNAGAQSVLENQFKENVADAEISNQLRCINEHLQIRAASSKTSVLTPLPHGFCLGISAHLIEAVGFLDSKHYPRGYGEENDYAICAAKAGFHARIALDAYIFHLGAASFTLAEKGLLRKRARQVLDSRHSPHLVAALIRQTEHIHHAAIAPLSQTEEQPGEYEQL
jgi:GT2 family glycosyltransferase